jgi:hypothetical protein
MFSVNSFIWHMTLSLSLPPLSIIGRLIAVGIENKVKFIVLVSLLDCHARTGILAAQVTLLLNLTLVSLH